MFCKHNWEILTEHISESMHEQNVRLFGKSQWADTVSSTQDMCKKVHLLVVKCDVCGKIKRIETEV